MSDSEGDKLYAHVPSGKQWESSKDVRLVNANAHPGGIRGDGRRIWVLDAVDKHAYGNVNIPPTFDVPSATFDIHFSLGGDGYVGKVPVTDPDRGSPTYDLCGADATDRIRELRERKEKPEATEDEGRTMLGQRRVTLDRMETIDAFAKDMSEYLGSSELTGTRAFIRSFVKEIRVRPGTATMRYTLPTPEDSPIGGADTDEVALEEGLL